MVSEVIERLEPFSFNGNEPLGLDKVNGAPGEAGADWADVFKFRLPAGFNYFFDPSSIFSARLLYQGQRVDAAIEDTAETLADHTAAARTTAATNFNPWDTTAQNTNDAFYVGFRFPFQGVRLNVVTTGVAGPTMALEYWTGSAWAALTGVDPAAASIWTSAGTGSKGMSWLVPTDWAKTLVGNHFLYFIRWRATSGTNFSTDPALAWVECNSGQEIAGSNLVRARWSDPNEQEERRLMGGVPYQSLTEFQQDSKLYRIPVAGRIVVPENYVVKIQARAKAPIDADASDFNVRCQRSRLALF